MSTYNEKTEYTIEVCPPWNILQCRREDVVLKDGVEISREYHRHIKCPGNDMSEEPTQMQAIATALWTDQLIADYQDSLS